MTLVIASCPLDWLLEYLGRQTTPFEDLPRDVTEVNPYYDGEPVLVGEVNGLAYLIEDAGTAFAHCWGLLARTARELDALVIGALYEAAEEHAELFVVRGPALVRAFWSNPRRTTQAYALGTPLASERDRPLSTVGGLTAALESFGFPHFNNAERALFPGERWVTWKGDLASLLAEDELTATVNQHVLRYPNPAYRAPVPVMKVRRAE